MPGKILAQKLRSDLQELARIKCEISENSAISYEERELSSNNIGVLISMARLVLTRASAFKYLY